MTGTLSGVTVEMDGVGVFVMVAVAAGLAVAVGAALGVSLAAGGGLFALAVLVDGGNVAVVSGRINPRGK